MVSSHSSSLLLERALDGGESERDGELRRRVIHFLADSNMPGLRQLDVSARDGVVTVSGRVRTYYEKQLSHQRCRRVAGVVQLIDKVTVAN